MSSFRKIVSSTLCKRKEDFIDFDEGPCLGRLEHWVRASTGGAVGNLRDPNPSPRLNRLLQARAGHAAPLSIKLPYCGMFSLVPLRLL